MPRRFLLWDHDGVLVDTERWYFEANRAVLQRLQIDLSEPQYLEIMAAGRSCWDLARAYQVPETRIGALRAARDALYQEFLQTKPVEIEGVAEVLAELAPRYGMAIITTARRCDFDLIHARRDLLDHFEFVLTVEDYARCRPVRLPGPAEKPAPSATGRDCGRGPLHAGAGPDPRRTPRGGFLLGLLLPVPLGVEPWRRALCAARLGCG